jgi:endonuclease/exonuclease/phosphatase family metal-dependent hydrolase
VLVVMIPAMQIYNVPYLIPDSTCPQQRLRLLSYNIQVGIVYSRYRHYLTRSWKHVLPFQGRQENLDSIAEFISKFDIVGLQEVDAGSLRSNYINQAKYLAQRGGFPHCYVQTNRNLGKIAQHGTGLLTKLRPIEVMEYRLPGKIPGRGALIAIFGQGVHKLMIGILHLSLGRKSRSRQLAYLAEHISHYKHVVLMGDFNCRIDHREFQELLDSTPLCSPERELHTYPSWRPKRGLDHILVTADLKVEQTLVYNASYSDHLPIAIDINLPNSITLDNRQQRMGLPPSREPIRIMTC